MSVFFKRKERSVDVTLKISCPGRLGQPFTLKAFTVNVIFFFSYFPLKKLWLKDCGSD